MILKVFKRNSSHFTRGSLSFWLFPLWCDHFPLNCPFESLRRCYLSRFFGLPLIHHHHHHLIPWMKTSPKSFPPFPDRFLFCPSCSFPFVPFASEEKSKILRPFCFLRSPDHWRSFCFLGSSYSISISHSFQKNIENPREIQNEIQSEI